VICQDVLEHLPRPRSALLNMARSLKPGGEIIIACSNPASVKGVVTKFTPHRFYRFVHKRGWFGYHYRGPDGPPFKTYMGWAIRPWALEQTLRGLGASVSQTRVGLSADPPREPPYERTEHQSDLGGEGSVGGRAHENAEC
jgi:SAM-dependent methyltransferase